MGIPVELFKIGEISIKAEKLINVTYEAMMKAIKIVKDGVHLGDIGSTIQAHVEARDFQLFKISADMGLEKHFIKNQIFYIMVKKELEKK